MKRHFTPIIIEGGPELLTNLKYQSTLYFLLKTLITLDTRTCLICVPYRKFGFEN